MRARTAAATGLMLVATTMAAPGALAAPPVQGPGPSASGDDLPNPLEAKRRALRSEALTKVIAGEARVERRGASRVVNLNAGSNRRAAAPAPDKYVELSREKTDKIFTILVEFGNQRDPQFPDVDSEPDTPGPTRFDGPLHNQIPKPGPQDNSTVWQPDYNRAHYQQLYFGTGADDRSVKQYYEKQSSGRYSVEGEVSDWVKVPYNEARYGRNPCGEVVCSNVWALVKDGLTSWVAQQRAAGRTPAQIKADLAQYDQWDRYDFDGDGNFNEADGYIDHFQVVHAGGDEADGDPIYGEDAIWSHRWYVGEGIGDTGPAGNPLGGAPVGNTGIWVGDYTMQPENGGVSVFVHEYGHDLGLPDLYDAATGGGSPVEWWSLMAQSRQWTPGDQGIGTRASDLSAWDKLQLGWLDYEVVRGGDSRTLDLGPHAYNTAKAQAVVVTLPKKRVVETLGAPASGSKQWWSGQGDNRTATLSVREPFKVPKGAKLTFKARWNIEDCGSDVCDAAYVEADSGAGFKALRGSITRPTKGNAIDGYQAAYKAATFDLSSLAGKTVKLRIRYVTDGAAQGQEPKKPSGIFVDDLALAGVKDGAETTNGPLVANGFVAVGASRVVLYDNYYIASNRVYAGYDKYLRTGPYNFGFPDKPNTVEHFPYQDGLLVSYWNTQYADNNVSEHPGEGLMLTVDANPRAVYSLAGTPWRNRVQLYDAPFGLQTSDSLSLHDPATGQASYIRGQAAQPLFDDRGSFFDPAVPDAGVKLPGTGVQMRVLSQSGTSLQVAISGGPAQ